MIQFDQDETENVVSDCASTKHRIRSQPAPSKNSSCQKSKQIFSGLYFSYLISLNLKLNPIEKIQSLDKDLRDKSVYLMIATERYETKTPSRWNQFFIFRDQIHRSE